jgi:hypothetical protein
MRKLESRDPGAIILSKVLRCNVRVFTSSTFREKKNTLRAYASHKNCADSPSARGRTPRRNAPTGDGRLIITHVCDPIGREKMRETKQRRIIRLIKVHSVITAPPWCRCKEKRAEICWLALINDQRDRKVHRFVAEINSARWRGTHDKERSKDARMLE